MKHHNKNRKFGRKTDERRAFLRSLAVSLIQNGRITTTEARAKELRPFVERLITKGKSGDLAARRLVESRLGSVGTAGKKVVEEIAPRYRDRAGGYTRIIKLPRRRSDGSPMAVIEFI